MRDDELRRLAVESNPWWRAAKAADQLAWTIGHRLLRERAAYDLGYRTDVLADIATAEIRDTLTVVVGPRRIGKSVALIDLAASLCARNDIDPRQVIHLPCDGLRDRDLRRALTLCRELTRSLDADHQKRRVWLIDEVTGIPGWAAALKAARDATAFGDDTVIATGSRWLGSDDALGSLLAGRAGTTNARRVRVLLPMAFPDFLATTRPELPRVSRVHPADLQDVPARKELEAVQFDVDGFDLGWQDYLTSGGFPRAVAEHARDGAVSASYLRDLEAWLRRDADPDAPPESMPLLLSALTTHMTSPLNATKVAVALGYSNPPTFRRRIDRLTATFAALPCPQRTDAGQRVAGSQAKLYVTDPILAWIPSRLRAGLPPPDFTHLSEMALGVALARTIDRLDEGRWVSADTIGYLRTGSGNEVDLCPVRVPSEAGARWTVPLESKWVDTGWRGTSKVIEARFSRGIVATKSILDLDHPAWAVPVPLVALLLG